MPWRITTRLSWPMYLDILTFWVFKRSSRLNRQRTTEDAKRQMRDKVKHFASTTSNGLKSSHSGLKLKTLNPYAANYRPSSCQRVDQSKTTVPSMLLECMISTLAPWTPSWIKCFPRISKPSTRKSPLYFWITPKFSKLSRLNLTQLTCGLRNFRTLPRRWTAREPWLCSGKSSLRLEPSTKVMFRKWRTYLLQSPSGLIKRRRCVMKKR